MTYMKPEMNIEKFDLIENIAGDVASAGDLTVDAAETKDVTEAAVASVASDMIIG